MGCREVLQRMEESRGRRQKCTLEDLDQGKVSFPNTICVDSATYESLLARLQTVHYCMQRHVHYQLIVCIHLHILSIFFCGQLYMAATIWSRETAQIDTNA